MTNKYAAFATPFLGFCFLLATPVSAAQAPDRTERVESHDLDLATRADRNRLDRRIRGAALRICGRLNDSLTTAAQCIAHSIKIARPQRNAIVGRAYRLNEEVRRGDGRRRG